MPIAGRGTTGCAQADAASTGAARVENAGKPAVCTWRRSVSAIRSEFGRALFRRLSFSETRSRARPCVNGCFSSMNSEDKALPPDVSVVIPCRNGAKYLPKLARSLRPLLAPNVEVIFIDDGSTDGSGELFQRLFPEAVLRRKSYGDSLRTSLNRRAINFLP